MEGIDAFIMGRWECQGVTFGRQTEEFWVEGGKLLSGVVCLSRVITQENAPMVRCGIQRVCDRHRSFAKGCCDTYNHIRNHISLFFLLAFFFFFFSEFVSARLAIFSGIDSGHW